MKWFKFYGQDYLSDPKMLALSSDERSCWITLLSYASVNDNGKITFLSEDQLMSQAGLDLQFDSWDRTKGVLEKFKNLGMIRIDNGVITVIHWDKRQQMALTPYERVKKFRAKKRNDNDSDNTKITLDKIRVDKNILNNNKLAEQSSEGKVINDLIYLFKEVNPSIEKFYQNKTQRSAIQRMLKIFGAERLEQIIRALPEVNTRKFWPKSTTPWELENNLGKYKAKNEESKNEKSKFVFL